MRRYAEEPAGTGAPVNPAYEPTDSIAKWHRNRVQRGAALGEATPLPLGLRRPLLVLSGGVLDRAPLPYRSLSRRRNRLGFARLAVAHRNARGPGARDGPFRRSRHGRDPHACCDVDSELALGLARPRFASSRSSATLGIVCVSSARFAAPAACSDSPCPVRTSRVAWSQGGAPSSRFGRD